MSTENQKISNMTQTNSNFFFNLSCPKIWWIIIFNNNEKMSGELGIELIIKWELDNWISKIVYKRIQMFEREKYDLWKNKYKKYLYT